MASSHLKLLQSLFAEMLASFIFGFTVYCTVINTKYLDDPSSHLAVTLGIAFSAVAIIYAFADHTISHFNPAITLSAILTRKLDALNGIAFIVFQVFGFILAALCAVVIFPGGYYDVIDTVRVGAVTKNVTNVNLFFSEFALTAILVYVAFQVSINARRDPAVSLYEDEPLPNRTIVAPLTIGLTLGFLSLIAVKTSGGSFNPGLIFAPMILINRWTYSWEYYVGQFTGGLFGALVQTWILFK